MVSNRAEDGRQMDDTPIVRLGGRKMERSRQAIPARVPIALRSTVHVTVSRGRFHQPWSRRIVLIKWVIAGCAAIEVGGRRITFGPGEVAVHLPDQPHRFWSLTETTELCWFSLDGPVAEGFVLNLGLASGVYPYGPPPTARIDDLMEALADRTADGWRRASQLAVDTLYMVAANAVLPLPSPLVLRAQHMIDEEFADPELSVARIAEELDCHRATLSGAFRQEAGMTAIDYITRVRMNEAILLLREANYPIATVARKCGFRDAVYFSRWCRKHTGFPPSQIRREPIILP